MLKGLFDLSGLAPHGICLSWRDDLFWSLAVSDAVIALSYISISGVIIFYVVRRDDMYLRWVAMAFALFILLCASSHLTDLWTLWSPVYGIQVVVKLATAGVSLLTALLLWPLLPRALALPSAARLEAANRALEREIAERRLVEASLRATEAELRAANDELDSFSYAVAHDLRAPLRAMSGFSEALKEDYGGGLDAEATNYLNQISLAGKHMGELVDGLLQLSRVTRGQLRREEVDISALAERIVDELRRLDPGRSIACEVEPGLTAWGDARMLESAMRNLLSNAWKYSAKAADPRVRVFGHRNDITVSDNGAGFDMAHSDRLFKPFQRLHRQDEFPGIGIGLSTVSRIIRRHGGSIQVEGAVGEGASFHFTVPAPEFLPNGATP